MVANADRKNELTALVVSKTVCGRKRLETLGHVDTVPGQLRERVRQILYGGMGEILAKS